MSETIFQAIQLPEPNLTEFSISEIGPAKHHSSVFSTTFIAQPNRILNQCFQEVQRVDKDKLKARILTIQRAQNLMKHKLENYMKLLEKELKKKEEGNNNLQKEINALQQQIADCEKDICILTAIGPLRSIEQNRQGQKRRKAEIKQETPGTLEQKIINTHNKEQKGNSPSSGPKQNKHKKSPSNKRICTSGSAKKKHKINSVEGKPKQILKKMII